MELAQNHHESDRKRKKRPYKNEGPTPPTPNQIDSMAIENDPETKKARTDRYVRLKQLVKKLRPKTDAQKEAMLQGRLEKNHDAKKAFEEYAWKAMYDAKLTEEEKFAKFKEDMIRAEVREKVSRTMHEEDKKLAPTLKAEIIQNQIHRFYDSELGNKNLRGHVDAPHAAKPPEEIKEWAIKNKIGYYGDESEFVFVDDNTGKIAQKTQNWMIAKRSRAFTDINSLPEGKTSSARTESMIYTRENSLNAIKAQRDKTAEMLKQQDNLDKDGKAKDPYLAVHLHAKVDTRGNDIELAAKELNGKGPINPLLAFWIAEKIKIKAAAKKLTNYQGELLNVNVVTYKGAYSGSNALTQLRHGDGAFDFQGFGENLQILQLECSDHICRNYPDELGQIIKELLSEFSKEFKKPDDLKALEGKYREQYEEKLEEKKIIFLAQNGWDSVTTFQATKSH